MKSKVGQGAIFTHLFITCINVIGVMKKYLFLLILFSCVSSAYAQSFGLKMGTSLDVLKKQMTLKDVGNYGYSTSSPPKGHPSFQRYWMAITPKHGLCRVCGFSKKISTNAYGTELKRKFEELEAALTSKDGTAEKDDFLKSGSIWDKQCDWMMGLLKNERTLTVYWASGNPVKFPDNIYFIQLVTRALTIEEGYVAVMYSFNNWNDCDEWIKAQANDAL